MGFHVGGGINILGSLESLIILDELGILVDLSNCLIMLVNVGYCLG